MKTVMDKAASFFHSIGMEADLSTVEKALVVLGLEHWCTNTMASDVVRSMEGLSTAQRTLEEDRYVRADLEFCYQAAFKQTITEIRSEAGQE